MNAGQRPFNLDVATGMDAVRCAAQAGQSEGASPIAGGAGASDATPVHKVFLYSGVQLVGGAVPTALSFLTLVVLTRYFPPSEYGAFGLAGAIAQMLAQSCYWWLTLCVMRLDAAAPAATFLASIWVIFAAIASVAVIAAVIYHILAVDQAASGVWMAGAIGSVALGYLSIKAGIFTARARFGRALAMSSARAISSLLLTVLAALQGAGGVIAFLSSVAGMVLPAPFFRHRERGTSRGKIDLRQVRKILEFGLPLAGSIVFLAISGWADRLIIDAYAGKAAVGLYAVAATLVQNTFTACAGAVGSVGFSMAVRAYESEGNAGCDRQMRHNFVAIAGLLGPAALGMALIAPNLAEVLIGPAYRETVVALTPLFAAAAVINGVRATYFDLAFHLSKKTQNFLWIGAVTAVVNLSSLLALVPLWGNTGAAVATLLTALASLACAAVAGLRCFRLPLPGRELVKIALALAVMSLLLYPVLHLRGPVSLALQIVLGAVIYSAALFALNLSNLRSAAVPLLLSAWHISWSRERR